MTCTNTLQTLVLSPYTGQILNYKIQNANVVWKIWQPTWKKIRKTTGERKAKGGSGMKRCNNCIIDYKCAATIVPKQDKTNSVFLKKLESHYEGLTSSLGKRIYTTRLPLPSQVLGCSTCLRLQLYHPAANNLFRKNWK